MKKIKASVLIANYNNQKYINDCLRSLVQQTYKNFEIIFQDDNSNDDSILNVKKYINLGLRKFASDVRSKKYPTKKHSY